MNGSGNGGGRVREPRIVIIGAGVAGISAAHVLREQGFADIRVLEKGDDVGGVWHWNRYPGLTCDVPSQIYQFGFAPKPDWSHIWASGEEIQQYHRDVVESLGLLPLIRFRTEVTDARFSDATGEWTLTTNDGGEISADFVLCATGVLHNPAYPDIPGLDSFGGPVAHTARWDAELATAGRRIAVLGTGSTGVQVVSALSKTAASLTHFVRSPQWVLWAPMGLPQIPGVAALLRSAPRLHDRVYKVLLWGSQILADITTRPSWRRRAVQAYARWSLKLGVRDEGLREELTPDGIVTEDGAHHDVDIIVLATGFRAHDYMRPMRITGREGITLDEQWEKGPRAYRMTAIPGLPNLFTVLGPNSPTGSISLQFSAELTSRYIAQWLDRFARGEVDRVEVTEEATRAFNEQVADAMGPTVWNTGCNSWYLTEDGSVDLWPFDQATMVRMLSEPDDAHFHTR